MWRCSNSCKQCYAVYRSESSNPASALYTHVLKQIKKMGLFIINSPIFFSIKYFFNLTLFWYALIIFCSKRGPTTTRNECIRIIYTKPATHHILLKINSGVFNNREILLKYNDRYIVYFH